MQQSSCISVVSVTGYPTNEFLSALVGMVNDDALAHVHSSHLVIQEEQYDPWECWNTQVGQCQSTSLEHQVHDWQVSDQQDQGTLEEQTEVSELVRQTLLGN